MPTATERKPRLSIGLPVYNGALYIEAAITSILSQTYSDLEPLICDDTSADDTQSICEPLASRDSRIRYVHHSTNLGSAANLFGFLAYWALTLGDRLLRELMLPFYLNGRPTALGRLFGPVFTGKSQQQNGMS